MDLELVISGLLVLVLIVLGPIYYFQFVKVQKKTYEYSFILTIFATIVALISVILSINIALIPTITTTLITMCCAYLMISVLVKLVSEDCIMVRLEEGEVIKYN